MADFEDFFDPPDDTRPPGPVCPVHHIELPASGVCDDC